ncbi:Uncharacterized protein LARI1_G001817 [Lachnellula arida]|uniref:Uncharacterized protein n=1 Tax=Lachnellula arida TaxID=1316785 RepID=A0A8T9BR24_9HELO|nr:Uncharacterized protein LARI1_G001817 [Lachnellula arida]
MAENQPNMEFQFVNSTIHAPTVPRDLAIRALIRKQAMKKASAERRRDGNYGKHNLRQFPVFIVDQENNNGQTPVQVKEPSSSPDKSASSSSASEKLIGPYTGGKHVEEKHKAVRSNGNKADENGNGNGVDRQRWLAQTLTNNFPGSLSAKGYELTSMKSGFDILDLSTLATLHIGRAARAALSQNPHHLIYQLRSRKQWSYLSYLPSLYGHVPCLSDAADCVIARARQIVSPHEKWEAAVITFYVKALDSLQKALDNPKQRYKPEVLCATEILALYELLDPSGETAWIRHAAGAAKLIQLRGPKNYNTEFEKALFMAHTGPIMTECLLNSERCFLEQKPWQKVFRSLIVDNGFQISDQSETTVSLIMLKAFIPGFFVDVTSIICSSRSADSDFVHTIASNLREQRAKLLKWNTRYAKVLQQYPDMRPGSTEYDSHCKVYATYLSCIMISSRLLAAISGYERAELEATTQGFADEMIEMDLRVKSSSEQTCLFMAQTRGVAGSIKLTAADWRDGYVEEDDSGASSRGLLENWKLERWCKSLARKMA